MLLNQPFVHAKVAQWTSTIIENVLKELAVNNGEAAKKGLQKFKYIGEARLTHSKQSRSRSRGVRPCIRPLAPS